MTKHKRVGPGRPKFDDTEYIREVKERRKRTPSKPAYSIALLLADDLIEEGKISIKRESFARRISDAIKLEEGVLPTPNERYALSQLRESIIATAYWFLEYDKGRAQKIDSELSPWMEDPMSALEELLSRLKSKS